MDKTAICLKILTQLTNKFPEIKDEALLQLNTDVEESYDLFKIRYNNNSDGDFETYIINNVVEDISMSLELESIDTDLEDFKNSNEGIDIGYFKLYEEKYKNIEKIIEKGTGSLSTEEKDILAAKNIPLIHSIVKRFANTGIEYSELLSAGLVGYAKGLQTFMKGKNVKFSTYAYRCIKNEILYFLRREKRHKDNDVSLSKPMSTDKNGNVMTVDSTISTEDMGARSVEEEIEMNETVKIMLEVIDTYLTPTEALIIKSRYGVGGVKPKTQKEIADEIGMSQANVSKLEKGISDKIKKIMSSKYRIKSI
jgi:RNA polymerase sporulation-specific sigma factor